MHWLVLCCGHRMGTNSEGCKLGFTATRCLAPRFPRAQRHVGTCPRPIAGQAHVGLPGLLCPATIWELKLGPGTLAGLKLTKRLQVSVSGTPSRGPWAKPGPLSGFVWAQLCLSL